MNKDMQFLRVVEIAAIATAHHVGKNDKNNIDKIAVENMRHLINEVEGQSIIKVGEGTLDEAPMLYVGEVLGPKNTSLKFDIAVDPIEGTSNAAINGGPSIAVLCFAKQNSIITLPDMYMEKIFISNRFKNLKLNLNNSLKENVSIMQTIKRPLTCVILDKPRHVNIIKDLENMGVIVKKMKDGDIIGAISVALGEIDFLYGVGGAPEGTIMAALALCSGCFFQGKLVKYESIWKNDSDCNEIQIKEEKLMKKYSLEYNKIYEASFLVSDDKIRFCSAFVTPWNKFKGVRKHENIYYVESVLASHGVIRAIRSQYNREIFSAIKPKLKFLQTL